MSEPKNQLRTLSRGLDVLERIEAAREPLSLTELAREMGESTPIVFRILQTLEERKYVYRRDSDKRYSLAGRASTRETVLRLMTLLRGVGGSGSRGASLSELATKTGFEPAVIEGLLEPLMERAIVEINRLGMERWRMSAKVLEFVRPLLAENDLTTQLIPVMERLGVETGETVSLFKRIGDEHVLTAVQPSRKPIRYVMEVGERFPLHLGAAGKAELAFVSSEQRARVFHRLGQSDSGFDEDRIRRLDAELDQVRKQRYATSVGERAEGAAAVASPVRDAAGAVCGVLSVMMPSFRVSEEELHRIGDVLVRTLQSVFIPATGEQFWQGSAPLAQQEPSGEVPS
ncbi:IclR family transcriptional regulator [Marinobacter sp. M1N3S26]|uniref:IclR family transcriptional regulator n=1 Tax=Marinobacter sp. M1N3S26 TaxID=3382299 RepID=UPI00387B88CC